MTAITSGCPSDRQVSIHQHRAIIEPAVDNRNQQAPASLAVFCVFPASTLDDELKQRQRIMNLSYENDVRISTLVMRAAQLATLMQY
ncbi:hypothetical protein [Pseudomonas sp. Z3-8]|uniref:hypothetical protein n=1 Tax=Pseudomonas sp. Z3-8 TaxID=2817412 RepID=UPI003DA91FD3